MAKWICIVITLLGVMHLSAQDITTKRDLSKKYKKVLQKSEADAAAGNYTKGIAKVLKVLKKYPDFHEGYLRLGGYYYNTKEYQKSKQALEQALTYPDADNTNTYYSLGYLQNEMEDYDGAVKTLSLFVETASPKNRKLDKAHALLASSRVAAVLVNNPVPFNPIPLEKVNTPSHEYLPQWTIDGKQLIFTRRVRGQEDFFKADREADTLGLPHPITSLNTVQNEGASSISADGNVLIFTGCDYRGNKGCDLYYSIKSEGTWSTPVNMASINSTSWDAQPCLSADGNLLLFSSKRSGGIGNKDVWYVTKNKRGSWDNPRPLPNNINTTKDEESPYLHPDGKTLYFRSNGHPGMGSFDIFKTTYDAVQREWSDPQNIGYPINSRGNDGALSLSADGMMAYMASDRLSRDSDNPNLDIFYFEMPESSRPTPTTYLNLKIMDASNGKPLEASISIVDYDAQDTIVIRQLAEKGFITLPLPAGRGYTCFVEHDGYTFYSQYLETDTIPQALKPYELTVKLSPLASKADEAKPITLNNIFFASGSSELLHASQAEIQKLFELLTGDTAITLEIVGHTDNVGKDEDNQRLSEERAHAVIQALIQLGADANRLKHKGLGESQPIDTNDTEDGRKNNRRTECYITYQK